MKTPLRILHLEDNPNDAELVREALESGGLAWTAERVETRKDFVNALERKDVDIIFSDFALPSFDGRSALEIARKQCPDVPFILVSGTLGEEAAIDSLRSGATDYVLKERLSRLVPAVRRAMQEVEEREARRQVEEQFIQSQKMEVLGQLAGGVAHDFNNVLNVIIGYSDLMIMNMADADPTRKDAEEIRQAADQAVALTRQLLAFCRKQTMQPVVLSLQDTVASMDKMLRRLLDENVELIVIPEKHAGRVKADPGYVGQILMNLIVNARDAMPNGGKLIIETKNVTLDEHYAASHPGVVPGNYVMLAVSDTGIGMTEEIKARMFEPFFTTKPKGQGTGLGLATCQTIIRQCNGHIGLYSEPGRGTTFKIYFPKVEEPLDTSVRSINAGPLPRGTETLLVAEDEPGVRRLTCNILEAQGYTVLQAINGQDALRVAREFEGGPIRLIITDLIMPQMGGREMTVALRSLYPDAKVLFTSGYTDSAMIQHGMLESDVACLPKPYTPATLTHKVRELLDMPVA